MSYWIKLTCDCPNPEEMSLWAVEFGASGSEIIDASKFLVFVENVEEILSIKEKLISQGVTVENEENIKEENWVKNCQDVWVPIEVGSLKLVPVLEDDLLSRSTNSKAIYILPGNGFGTGHHESTQIALEILQDEALKKSPPISALDVGTGNGILALATTLLYKSNVLGLDNDILAINNAAQNLELNGELAPLITLKHADIKASQNGYDLLLANIYSHTLCSLSAEFRSRLRNGGFIILSGIMKHQEVDIKESFTNSDWEVVRRLEKSSLTNGDWVGFLLRRIN